MKWIKIAESVAELEFGTNNMAVSAVEGKKICIGLHKEKLFAFAYKCPHAGGVMADGYIDALGNVVCPLHKYKFCMENGRNVSGEGYFLKTYPVDVTEEGVFVGVEQKSIFKLF